MRPDPGLRVRFAASPAPEPSLEQKLRDACAMADFARELVGMKVRLDNPNATDADIDDAVRAWLAARPDALGFRILQPEEFERRRRP